MIKNSNEWYFKGHISSLTMSQIIPLSKEGGKSWHLYLWEATVTWVFKSAKSDFDLG